MGDAAKQAKARYCTEHWNVDIEAKWTESRYTYPERSDAIPATVRASAQAETEDRTNNILQVPSEVSRGHSKPETSCTPKPGDNGRGLMKGRRTEC